MASTIGPAPQFPERTPVSYERKFSPAQPGLRGPLRFEEGLATDDVELLVICKLAAIVECNGFSCIFWE